MKLYLDERGNTVSYAEIKSDFDELSAEEKAEYDGKFGAYLAACMYYNGGTLKPL